MILNIHLAAITVSGTEWSVYKRQLFHFCSDGENEEEEEEEKDDDEGDEVMDDVTEKQRRGGLRDRLLAKKLETSKYKTDIHDESWLPPLPKPQPLTPLANLASPIISIRPWQSLHCNSLGRSPFIPGKAHQAYRSLGNS